MVTYSSTSIGDFTSAVEYSNVSLIKSISAAYKLADERKNEDRKTELLSIFVTAENVSREALSKIVGCNISARKFTQARHHGVHHGPGQPVNNTVHPRGNEVKRVIIAKFVKYLMERGVQTANGRTVSIPGKEGISLPNIKRLEGMQPLIKAFEEQGRRSRVLADRCEWISLRRQSMEEVIRVVCPQKHISMAALDVVGQQHGVLNFRVLKKKIVELSVLFQDMGEKSMNVLREIEDVEEGLSSRSKYRSEEHFCGVINNCGPASHCHYYAFGKVDPVEALPESTASIKFPCGHYHRGVCAMCQQLHSFGGLLDDLSVGASENVLEKIKEMNLKYHYKGHQARLDYESMAANKIKEKLKSDATFISVTCDYEMKFLPLKDSEAQNEFFGKAGINWHGVCILWYNTTTEKYLQYYVNQCVDDSTEDGISVAALLSQVHLKCIIHSFCITSINVTVYVQ